MTRGAVVYYQGREVALIVGCGKAPNSYICRRREKKPFAMDERELSSAGLPDRGRIGGISRESGLRGKENAVNGQVKNRALLELPRFSKLIDAGAQKNAPTTTKKGVLPVPKREMSVRERKMLVTFIKQNND